MTMVGGETSGYFIINVVLIWESITEMCHFFPVFNSFLWFKQGYCIGIHVEKLAFVSKVMK